MFVVDDAQWLDRPSAQVLRFVARRIESDPAVMLFAVREGVPSGFDDAGLAGLPVPGLNDDAAGALIDLVAAGLPSDLRRRILGDESPPG